MTQIGLLDQEAGDLVGAEAWFVKAAELGDEGAMNMLGYQAIGADNDDVARAWWEQAAGLQNHEAMFNLGVLADECGDAAQARAWFEKAAALGDEDAANRLRELDS
jgi:TPR repeat protein